jgi:hypothetical protein
MMMRTSSNFVSGEEAREEETPGVEAASAYLARARALVDAQLQLLAPAETIEPVAVHAAIRWSLLAGGKRLRPALVLATGEACGASSEQLVRTACAFELVHTYSLVHDDLPAMDDDDLRRGRPTCHVKFGEATAILAGDAMQALAFQIIAGDDALDARVRVRLISELACAAGTPAGWSPGRLSTWRRSHAPAVCRPPNLITFTGTRRARSSSRRRARARSSRRRANVKSSPSAITPPRSDCCFRSRTICWT